VTVDRQTTMPGIWRSGIKAITDATIKECLDRIRVGEMAAVGVLAARLNELNHPLAAGVREAWNFYESLRKRWEWWDFVKFRRRLTREHYLGFNRRDLFVKVRKMFRMKWQLRQVRWVDGHKVKEEQDARRLRKLSENQKTPAGSVELM
jgi:hypothetical protein